MLPVSTGIMPDTIAAAGVFSSRAVEAYRLHPSRLKSLASKATMEPRRRLRLLDGNERGFRGRKDEKRRGYEALLSAQGGIRTCWIRCSALFHSVPFGSIQNRAGGGHREDMEVEAPSGACSFEVGIQ